MVFYRRYSIHYTAVPGLGPRLEERLLARHGDLVTAGLIIGSLSLIVGCDDDADRLIEQLVPADLFAFERIGPLSDAEVVHEATVDESVERCCLVGEGLCEHVEWSRLLWRPDWILGQSPICCSSCGGRVGLYRLSLPSFAVEALASLNLLEQAWDAVDIYAPADLEKMCGDHLAACERAVRLYRSDVLARVASAFESKGMTLSAAPRWHSMVDA